MMGWATKLTSSGGSTWSFSIAKYGPQTSYLGDSGTGYSITNNTRITWNDPNDANFPTNSTFQSGYVQHLTNFWKTAAKGGVKYYAMDNEPLLWNYTHRDIHPQTVTSNEIRNDIFDYAAMVKRIDAGSQVIGMEEWDYTAAATYYPWLLGQLHNYQNTNGTRLLDYVTLHYYAAYAGAVGTLDNLLSANRSTRSLWDQTYVDESWKNQVINLIPTMKSWVTNNYPGTKTGITEYNWGFDGQMEGAVLQADALGIFGREGLDMATRWGSTANNPTNIIFKAMKMYRNYDGNKSTFGDISVSAATTNNPDEVSFFAAQHTSDNALTVMVINKQPLGDRPISLSVSNFVNPGVAKVWQLTATNVIERLNDLALTGNTLVTTAPAQSITLFVIGSGAAVSAGSASSPNPTNNSVNVSVATSLSWTAGSNAINHNVFLGTSSNAVAAATISSPEYLGVTTTTSFSPGLLSPTTAYFWRVDEQANGTPTIGNVWSFTTGAPLLGNVTLTGSDGANYTSFTNNVTGAVTNWSNGQAPNSSNKYFTGGNILRTPNASSGNIAFAGASLSIDNGGYLRLKGNTGSAVTIGSLKLNGGTVQNGVASTTQGIYGNVTVVADSILDGDNSGRVTVIYASISGSANLQTISSEGAGGLIQLAGTNNAFTGGWSVSPTNTLQIGIGVTSGSLGSGSVTNNGTLIFNRSDALNVTNPISGTGSVTIGGLGTITLAGTNTYTGTTTVTNGTLLVNGALGNTTLTVSNGASLGGNGTIAGLVTVNGTFSPGAGGISKLTVSNALALTGSSLFEINKLLSPSNDTVTVTGTLTAGGTLLVTNLGGALATGDTFALFNKAVAGSFSSTILPSLPNGLAWQNNLAVNGSITVVALPVGLANNPVPANGATGVGTNTNLTWLAGSNAILHRVYFGANSNTVAIATTNSAEFKASQATTNFAPGLLAPSGKFFWRIDELGIATLTVGPVWTFATVIIPTNTFVIGGCFSNKFSVSFPSLIGQTYRVEQSPSLNPANWQIVSNNIPATGGVIQILDSASGISTQLFYRVVILNP